MKKIISIMLIILVSIGLLLTVYSTKGEASQKSISEKIIRFHVLANSDTKLDQNLKLKVRDKVLAYISPKLKNSKSIEESRSILKQNNMEIKKIAEDVIKKNGYKYSVTTELAHENFPIKTYGNITLPQGNYEAYRIIIGKGKGHNWWCVMFPPLCFVDISKGEVAYKQTEKDMKKVLTNEEYKLVDNNIDNKDIKIKFKIFEIFDKIKN